MCNCTVVEEREYWVDDWDEGRIKKTEKVEYACTVDIGVHRYKCTKCGEIGYYSGAARDYYTKGIKSHVKGLGYD